MELKRKDPGIRELVIALPENAEFKDVVRVMEKILTVPELPGIKGCAPCLSGLDRFVIQSDMLQTIR